MILIDGEGGWKIGYQKASFVSFWYFLPFPNIYFSLKIKQAGQLSSKPWLSLISLIKLFLQFFFRRKLYKLRLLWMSSSTWMFPSTLSLIGSRHAIQRKEFLKISLFLLFRFGIWAQKVFFTAFDWYFTPWIRILRTALKNSFIFNEF